MNISKALQACWQTFAVSLCLSVSLASAADPSKPPGNASPKSPPAGKPAEPAALKYGWRAGAAYTYQVQFEIDIVERIRVLRCACSYIVRPTDKDQIVFHGSQAGKATGTAFVVAANGYLLTCAHVVENAEKIDVALGGKNYEAKVQIVDETNDLALLRIDAQGLRFLPLFESDNVEVGQDIRVMGFPLSSELGENIKVTRGIVTGINLKQDVKRFQVDAAVNPGNSGGPMVNEKGEVIAIADSKLAGVLVSNVAFGVPANHARKLLEQKKVKYTVGTSAAKAEGPELVKRVSPAVALVTVTPRQARLRDDGEHFSLTLHTTTIQSDRAKPGQAPIAAPASPFSRRPSHRPGSVGGRRPTSRIYGSPSLTLTALTRDEKNLQMDELGCVLDAQGAGLSCLMFGSLPMIEPLSPDGKRTWEVKREQVAIDELGLGPVFRSRQGGEPAAGAVLGVQRVAYKIGETAGDIVTIKKEYELKSTEKKNGVSIISLSGEGSSKFDTRLGAPREMEFKGVLVIHDDSMTIKLPITATGKFADGKEPALVAAPAPAAPASPAPASPAAVAKAKEAEFQQYIVDLGDVDAQTRRTAATRISFLPPQEPREEVVAGLTPLLHDADPAIQQAAIRALGSWGSEKNTPDLLVLLDHEQPPVRWAVMEALGKLQDPLAAEPLALALAKDTDRSSASRALQKFGAAAEPAVLKLLDSEAWATRLEVVRVLRVIGGVKSRIALAKAVDDPQPIVARAAQEALTALQDNR